MNTDDDLKSQLEKLRTNSKALLDEKKQEKSAHDATKLELTTALEANAQLTTQLTAIRLDAPVERLIGEIAVDPRVFRLLFEQDYSFALNDENKPIITNKEGKQLQVKDKDGKEHPLDFNAKDLTEFLAPVGSNDPNHLRFAGMLIGSKASGSGASGTNSGSLNNAPPFEQKPEAKPISFGLR